MFLQTILSEGIYSFRVFILMLMAILNILGQSNESLCSFVYRWVIFMLPPFKSISNVKNKDRVVPLLD